MILKIEFRPTYPESSHTTLLRVQCICYEELDSFTLKLHTFKLSESLPVSRCYSCAFQSLSNSTISPFLLYLGTRKRIASKTGEHMQSNKTNLECSINAESKGNPKKREAETSVSVRFGSPTKPLTSLLSMFVPEATLLCYVESAHSIVYPS